MLAMDSPHSAYVARLYDPTKLQVRVDVPLADAHKIGVGTPTELTAEAVPNRTLRGEITRIVNEADLTKNTLQFKVRIIDPPEGLKPEMLARVKFLTTPQPQNAAAANLTQGSSGDHLPFVPERLVTRDGAGASVLIADRARGVAVRKSVTLTENVHDGWIGIRSGVAAGDAIIESPANLADGARITVLGEADVPTDPDNEKAGADHGVH
jgi:multidrug efflux pump subunit AcrA (membrane-fusion protein)